MSSCAVCGKHAFYAVVDVHGLRAAIVCKVHVEEGCEGVTLMAEDDPVIYVSRFAKLERLMDHLCDEAGSEVTLNLLLFEPGISAN